MPVKDTVLELKQLTEVRTAYPANEVSKAQMVADQKKIKEQAKISFSLGEQQGIRKVVEWINYYINLPELPELRSDNFNKIFQFQWQIKLQEWEIQ